MIFPSGRYVCAPELRASEKKLNESCGKAIPTQFYTRIKPNIIQFK